MVKVLVSAATGTVGQWVCKYLHTGDEAKNAHEVRAAVRDPESDFAKAVAAMGATPVAVDYTDDASLDAALDGVEVFVFITPLVADHQALSTKWVDALHRGNGQKIQHVVRLSCLHADKPNHAMARWHAATEAALSGTGIAKVTCVRPGVFMQNFGNHYGPTIKATKTHYHPNGDAPCCYVDARDVARTIVKAIVDDSVGGKPIRLQGAAPLTQKDVTQALSEACGHEIKFEELTAGQAASAMEQAGVPRLLCAVFEEINEIIAKDESAFGQPTNDIKDVLGRDAVSFAKYAKSHVFLFK